MGAQDLMTLTKRKEMMTLEASLGMEGRLEQEGGA